MGWRCTTRGEPADVECLVCGLLLSTAEGRSRRGKAKEGEKRSVFTVPAVQMADDVAKWSPWFQNRRDLVIYKRARERSFEEMDGQVGPRHRSGARNRTE